MSGDGNTAIIGEAVQYAPTSDTDSATIFTRSGTTWTQQQILTQSGGAANDEFGISVALSSDGNTAIVGADKDNSNQGSATIFTRSGTTWTQQQILTQSGGAAGDYFGMSVALSADGNTAIVGAYAANAGQGSATIFTRSGSEWTQQQTITQSDGAAGDEFGISVASSSNGNTVMVGAPGGNSYHGYATLFSSGEPPNQPAIPVATATNEGAEVSWTSPLWNGGSNINSYVVTANPGGRTCSWTTGPLSCPVMGLTNGQSYTFTVTATNGVGTGSASNASSAVTPRTIPSSPRNVTATGGLSTQSTISWDAPISEGGNRINSYLVTANPGGRTCPWSSGPLSCTITDLTKGTPYTFSVTATNLAGASNASSPSASITLGNALTISTFSGSGTVTNGTGTMSCTSVCTANQADSATITATPAMGWVFSSWGGACSGATRVCSLLMNQARDVSVFFVEAPANTPPNGGGTGFTSNPITIPAGVQWSVENLSLVARFAGTTGLTYTIRATQGSTIKTGSCVDIDSAITCTVRVAAGTWTGEVTPSQGATSGTPASKKQEVVAVDAIRSVAWGAPSVTNPLVASFSATTGTTYLITATLTKAAKTLRIATTKGTCKIKNGKTTCSIKLKTKGTWSVVITPKKNGSLGTPVKKTVKV